MSFQRDLELSDGPVAVDEVRAFLEERRWYSVREGGAQYDDGDTSVAFTLEWAADGGEVSALVFEMSTPRPLFFGWEAASELEALAAEFELEDGAFDVDAFVEEWRAAVEERLENGASVRRLEADRLRDTWRWNRAREDYQTVLGEGVFVPSLRLMSESDEVYRAAVWPEAIPFALPDAADLVLLSGLGREGLVDGGSELRVADADDVVELVEMHSDELEWREDPTDHLLIGWARPPGEVRDELADVGVAADERALEPVAFDDVVEEESSS